MFSMALISYDHHDPIYVHCQPQIAAEALKLSSNWLFLTILRIDYQIYRTTPPTSSLGYLEMMFLIGFDTIFDDLDLIYGHSLPQMASEALKLSSNWPFQQYLHKY